MDCHCDITFTHARPFHLIQTLQTHKIQLISIHEDDQECLFLPMWLGFLGVFFVCFLTGEFQVSFPFSATTGVHKRQGLWLVFKFLATLGMFLCLFVHIRDLNCLKKTTTTIVPLIIVLSGTLMHGGRGKTRNTAFFDDIFLIEDFARESARSRPALSSNLSPANLFYKLRHGRCSSRDNIPIRTSTRTKLCLHVYLFHYY